MEGCFTICRRAFQRSQRKGSTSLISAISSVLCAAILFFALSEAAIAAERYEFYNGVRQMGMGGTAVGVVNDETALLLNPAALGKVRDYIFTVADPEISGSSNALTFAGLNLINMLTDPQDILNKLNDPENRAERMHLKAQIFPSFVTTNFGIGVFGKYSVDAEVDAAGTNFELNYFNDFSLVAGFNFRLWDGRIKMGFNARAVNRVQIQRTDIPANSTNLTVDALASEGFGVGSDVGLILTAPVATLPSLSAVWRDVGRTTYTLKDGLFTSATTTPASTNHTVDVALSFFPILGRSVRSTWSVEYRDVLTTSDEDDHMRRVHAGIEFNFSDAFFLRAGMNQRYWTAGLELAMFNYQVQFASYGEEIGTATVTEEDRRYIMKFAFRF